MEQANEVIDYIKNKRMIDETKANVMSRFPFLGAYVNNLEIEPSNCETARTNGNKVKYNPQFMESLSEDERTFTLAHEIMHIAFDHIKRGKDGKRDMDMWNIATDAVINQMLEHGGLPIKKGFINMPEALDKSADEMYEIIKDKKQNNNPENGEGGDGLPPPPDNHDEWEPPEDENQNNDQDENEKDNNGNGDATPDENGVEDENQNEGSAGGKDDENGGASDEKDDSDKGSGKDDDNKKGGGEDYAQKEKDFNKSNDQMKKEMVRQILEEMEKSSGKEATRGAGHQKMRFGDVGEAKKTPADWRKILKKEIENDEVMWSYRRADADNYYQARIEVLEQNNRPITQVLLDTSGSVSGNLLRNFLRQLKPLLKDSELDVGCFDDEFYGFHKIKKQSDINNFEIVGRGGTNFNLAVKSFSKDPKINKIVFTDGEDEMSLNDKKYDKIIWVVFDNPEFKIAHGKVINVSSSEINQALLYGEREM